MNRINALYHQFQWLKIGSTTALVVIAAQVVWNVEVTQIIHKTHGLISDDRRMKMREGSEAVGTLTGCVHHILHEYLDMRKLSV